ncbi:hypothetical protein C3E80_06920 [Cronobacter malonaticus]|uniref:Uncharacterized protein n=1 Tax=Cronobacter malonaticus TaxID=413503 RepID=A0A423XZ80_9ENTR|nr:hypothetical protein C3E80_06920 [Cronobacter malonaticus]RRA38351.1 hypothetical protein C4882_20990 [Cronobacter malonaticus]
MRLLAGGECGRVATFEIPEVLIGEVSDLADHNTYTNLRGCAGFFLPAFHLAIIIRCLIPLPHHSLRWLCQFLLSPLFAESCNLP